MERRRGEVKGEERGREGAAAPAADHGGTLTCGLLLVVPGANCKS